MYSDGLRAGSPSDGSSSNTPEVKPSFATVSIEVPGITRRLVGAVVISVSRDVVEASVSGETCRFSFSREGDSSRDVVEFSVSGEMSELIEEACFSRDISVSMGISLSRAGDVSCEISWDTRASTGDWIVLVGEAVSKGEAVSVEVSRRSRRDAISVDVVPIGEDISVDLGSTGDMIGLKGESVTSSIGKAISGDEMKGEAFSGSIGEDISTVSGYTSVSTGGRRIGLEGDAVSTGKATSGEVYRGEAISEDVGSRGEDISVERVGDISVERVGDISVEVSGGNAKSTGDASVLEGDSVTSLSRKAISGDV
jgi:hypothetical protein